MSYASHICLQLTVSAIHLNKRIHMKRLFIIWTLLLLLVQPAWGARAKIDTISRDPYLAALVIDANSGKILFEDNAAARAYPASVLKLMVLLIVLEQVEQGVVQLDEMVQVTREAAQMGGSQVYLDPKEQFSVEDLVYALTIQSANDAAVALAIHIAGSKEGFVALMNKRAGELGMDNTVFSSVHGLPPSQGQKPDITTAKDLAILGRVLASHPETFKYTGTREREFRGGEFIMRTHNHLLASIEGCDGFKTGYFKAAGFSIMATAERKGVRILAIVLGSSNRKVRDAKASELIAKGFSLVPPDLTGKKVVKKVQPVPAGQTVPTARQAVPKPADTQSMKAEDEPSGRASIPGGAITVFILGFAAGLITSAIYGLLKNKQRSSRRKRFY